MDRPRSRRQSPAVAEWFDTVREECSKTVWSRGVELVRSGAVSEDSLDGDEVCMRVVTRGGMISHEVVLDTELGDWECDCKGRDDPCEHVAAAAIALNQTRSGRTPAKGPGAATAAAVAAPAPGRIRYHLSRVQGGLTFEREIVRGQEIHALSTTLESIASGRVDGPAFAATGPDIDVERILGSRRHGRMPRETMARLLRSLARCSDVRLDGEPVAISAEPVLPLAVLRDAPGGFELRVVPDPKIEENFGNGVVLWDGTLCSVGDSRLTGREWADLPEGRYYGHDQAVELVTQVLPSLESRIRVERKTKRLPVTGRREKPRLLLQTERRDGSLSVLPLLVYGDPPRARVDGRTLVHIEGALPVRDQPAERRLVTQLRKDLGMSPGHLEVVSGEAAVELAERLRGWQGNVEGEAHEAFGRVAPLVPRLDPSLSKFELDFESTDEEVTRTADADNVLRAWSEGQTGLMLSDGSWAPLPADWLERFGPVLTDLLAARSEKGALPASALPDLAELCLELDHPEPPELAGLAPLLDPEGHMPEPTVPSGLESQLRAYQHEGVRWLEFLRRAGMGALLADDMGLGKTLQTLCVLEGRTLVIAPRSLLHNWMDEIVRFRPELTTCLYHGPGRALDPKAQVTLTSYAILRLDSEALAAVHWDAAVLDEAQAIKNPESKVARAAFGLQARSRIALTGTPVENRLEELWSQLHFLNPGLLGGRRDFRERYAGPIGAGDTDAAARLRRRLRPFMLRRLKRDVAPELPPRTELVLHCSLDEEERRVYDALEASSRKEVVSRLVSGERGSVMAALEALLRLRQAACHRGLVPGQEAESSSKVELLTDRLEQAAADGHRSLVFSQWTSLLDRVEPALASRGIPFDRLDGSTRDRGGVVSRFQSESGTPVLLVSLRAGGAGLNLTAADHVFLMDPWWNPAVEDQAADRAHRIGQQRPVFIHRLVAERTVEEGILALQQRKRGLADAALGDADGAASLGRDDLLELLG